MNTKMKQQRRSLMWTVLVVGIIIPAMILLVPIPSVRAAPTVITVNTTADPGPSNGVCGGTCSLRYAVNTANTLSGATIAVPAGTYALALGAISISKDMSIIGAGAISTTVDGGGTDRIFVVGSNITVAVVGMTLQRGFSPGVGGAIQDYGNLVLDSVTLFNNIANNSGGGVVAWSGGALMVKKSTVISNTATFGAGISGYETTDNVVVDNSVVISNTGSTGVGIDSVGPLTITHSIISSNIASSYGGGIRTLYGGSMSNSIVNWNTSHNHAGGLSIGGPSLFTPVTFTITNSTISNNSDTYSNAGGLDVVNGDAAAVLINSTVSNNSAPNSGGGIYVSAGSVGLFNTTVYSNSASSGGGVYVLNGSGVAHSQNTIVAGNSASTLGQDCYGTINSQGYNLVQNTTNCNFVLATGDITGKNPVLGALQNNGGTTYTHALLMNSPAINAGDPTGCKDNNGTTLITDQRAFPRPFGGRCDIGSFEYQSLLTRGLYLPLIQR